MHYILHLNLNLISRIFSIKYQIQATDIFLFDQAFRFSNISLVTIDIFTIYEVKVDNSLLQILSL